jgi:hypothetical protein
VNISNETRSVFGDRAGAFVCVNMSVSSSYGVQHDLYLVSRGAFVGTRNSVGSISREI